MNIFLGYIVVTQVDLNQDFKSIESFLVYSFDATVAERDLLKIWQISNEDVLAKITDEVVIHDEDLDFDVKILRDGIEFCIGTIGHFLS